ncbi:uncharacterized protein LOC134821398 [Bolinopsis microptera]|uniref:uncharacterized protein LOC134821398 n=1 Tax=Bolinopsis microptera TaxID=2820187 RepID=UPI003078A637
MTDLIDESECKLQSGMLCLVLRFYFQQLPALQTVQTSGSKLQWKEIGEYLNKLTDPANDFLPLPVPDNGINFSHTLKVTYDKIITKVISDNDFLDPNSRTRHDEEVFQSHIRMTEKLHFYLQQLRELKTTSEGDTRNCFEELLTFMDHMTKLQPQDSLGWEDIVLVTPSEAMIESLNGNGEVRSYYTKGTLASRKNIKICHFKILKYWALLSNQYAVTLRTTSDHLCLLDEIEKTLQRVGQFLLMTSWMANEVI